METSKRRQIPTTNACANFSFRGLSKKKNFTLFRSFREYFPTVHAEKLLRGGSRQSQFYILHYIQCLKNILNWILILYWPKSEDFFEVWGVCVCVCVSLCDPVGLHDKSVIFIKYRWVSKSWPLLLFVLQGPIFSDIRGHSDPKNICQIAGNGIFFSKFSGGVPRPHAGARAFGARFGASPLYRAPLSKIPGSAPVTSVTFLNYTVVSSGNHIQNPVVLRARTGDFTTAAALGLYVLASTTP